MNKNILIVCALITYNTYSAESASWLDRGLRYLQEATANLFDNKANKLLMRGVENKNLEQVRQALKQGANVNLQIQKMYLTHH